MKNMKNRILTIAIAGMVTLASCADLTVENLNNPDTERALSSVSDLTTLAEGLIKSWHNGIHSYSGMGMPTAVLADAASCSWGNVGMREMGTEPRPAFDNAPNYGYRYLTATPLSSMYSINSSASDVIKAIQNPDIDFGSDAARVEAAFRIILRDENVKAILINIFGGIVRCDRVAQGVVDAYKNIGDIPVPIIVRLQGTNADIAKKLIDESGLNVHSAITLQEAADQVTNVVA